MTHPIGMETIYDGEPSYSVLKDIAANEARKERERERQSPMRSYLVYFTCHCGYHNAAEWSDPMMKVSVLRLDMLFHCPQCGCIARSASDTLVEPLIHACADAALKIQAASE